MKNVRVNGHEYGIGLFVFDKDGLMFENKQFWIELAQARIRAIETQYPEIPAKIVGDWMTFSGASWIIKNGFLKVTDVDPCGILAIAPVPEERISSAAFFKEHMGIDWVDARKLADEIFRAGDGLFDLKASLKPRRGFPDILRRLREAGIPYGVATSDTKERVKSSLGLYDDPTKLAFAVTLEDVENGKPYPDMLQLICKRTGVPMGQIAMLGDSWVDVAMARAAGAVGIGIPEKADMRRRMQGIAAEIIDSLEDIEIYKRA